MKKQTDRVIVVILSLASFLHDVGSDMVFSVWPLFVTQVLKTNMMTLGLIDGIGDAVVSISGAVGGYFSDKIRKRKIFVWTGYLFGGVSRIDRSGKIRGAPRDAIISDISTHQNRGVRFGVLRAMDNLGAVVGILIAIFFLKTLGFTNLFILAAIPSVVAVLLIVFFIHEVKPNHKTLFKGVSFKNFNNNLRLLTILSGLFALGSFSYSFLLLFANRYGFTTYQIPILYLLFTLVAAICSIPFGKLSDQFGRKNILYLSYFFWAVVLILFIFYSNSISAVLAFIFYGLHKGAMEPVQKTLVAELAPSDYVASTIGAFQMLIGLMALPASFLAGFLWDNFSPVTPFYFSLALTIISGVMLKFVKESK